MNACSTCSPRTQSYIGLGLMALMAATRFHHFGDALHMPDASWAVFFLAGLYLAPAWLLAFLLQAVAIDYVAIEMMGTSAFCVTPAYAALLPAYAVLWVGGRWLARNAGTDLSGLGRLAGAVVASTLVAFAISNGAFYWMGGRVAETSMAQYVQTWIDYAPAFLGSTLMYLAAAVVVHSLVLTLARRPIAARAR